MAATILVVEDEPAIQDLISYSLRQARHIVFSARNAEEAMEIINDALPDLVLRSLDLPGDERTSNSHRCCGAPRALNNPYHHAYGSHGRRR